MMTVGEKKTLMMLFSQYAEIFNRNLSAQTLATLVESLVDLPYSQVYSTLSDWLKSNQAFPMPAQIREIICPGVTGKDEAIDAVNRIMSAISSCGYNNPDRAKEKVGELGWAAVQRFGGWSQLCQSVTSYDIEPTIRAQLRELITVLHKKSLRGDMDIPPPLPTSRFASLVQLKSLNQNAESENPMVRISQQYGRDKVNGEQP